MFWGLGSEVWLQLWSGVIGSLVGAIGAAGVALLVLWRTNLHQAELARRALEEQRSLSEKALTAQRDDAKRALDEQRNSLERQLTDQRSESSRARELAAIADFLSAVVGVVNGADDLSQLDAHDQQLRSARYRMTFEPGSRALGEALRGWVSVLARSVRLSHMVSSAHHVMPLPNDADDIAIDYIGISARMREAASTWPVGDEGDRQKLLTKLRENLSHYEERSTKIRDHITPYFTSEGPTNR
ncbi:hypothetical protein [Arthrobacter agilis]|uniref:hypothetical protein n=1 Tax=Arthrobacter agilis TaxID=37921 RepID=UPI0027867C12|nr:hypothetical protein [Arthrobacter agilis]MDQ0735148.1 hypothetical protein [Arthrobacter agilis]